MITKLKVNKDEFPTNSCQQSGWQAFLLEFSNTPKGKSKYAKEDYLEEFDKEDNYNDVDGLSV